MEREAKAKVVSSVWGAEFIQFLAVLAIFPRSIGKNRMNSTFNYRSKIIFTKVSAKCFETYSPSCQLCCMKALIKYHPCFDQKSYFDILKECV